MKKNLLVYILIILWAGLLICFYEQYQLIETQKSTQEKLLYTIKQSMKSQKLLNDYLIHLQTKVSILKIQNQVEKIRKMKFKENVRFTENTRDEVKKYIQKKMNEQISPEEMIIWNKTLIAFGYLPKNYDLGEKIKKLYQEQVGAYYDPVLKTLVTISDLNLSKNLNNTIISHEITHALQDQFFDLEKMINQTKSEYKNDDQQLALQSVVEGDATYVCQMHYLKNFSIGILSDILTYFSLDQKEIKSSPLFLRETLVFPYIQGAQFIVHLEGAGGWDLVNKAFQNPPESTEQLLHPLKYYSDKDKPIKIDIPDIKKIFPNKQKLDENTVGEFGMQLLFRGRLSGKLARKSASGWGGDRYEVWGGREDPVSIYWKIEMDSEEDSIEFVENYLLWHSKAYPQAKIHIKSNTLFICQKDDLWTFFARKSAQIVVGINFEKKSLTQYLSEYENVKEPILKTFS